LFLGDDHPDTLASLNNLAIIFDIKGEHDRALPLYEECLEKHQRVLGDDHPYTLTSLNNLACLFYRKHEYDRALILYEKCLEKYKRVLGDDHPDTCASLRNLQVAAEAKAAADAKAVPEAKAAAEAMAPAAFATVRRVEVSVIAHAKALPGGNGVVRQAMYNGRLVAMKQPLITGPIGARDRAKFMKEMEINYRLHHAACVTMYGACIDDEGMLLLMEWMEGGSLYSALDNHSVKPVLPRMRISMARDIADGLCYMHTNGIVHRDLKSHNVLLTLNGHAKLCDFGLATLQTLTSTRTAGSGAAAGTYPWFAPEMFQGASCNQTTDVYAFGIIMWELLTCEVPFQGLNEIQVRGLLERGQRPDLPCPLPFGFSSAYIELMKRCWHQVITIAVLINDDVFQLTHSAGTLPATDSARRPRYDHLNRCKCTC
jgi:hypothetical protein